VTPVTRFCFRTVLASLVLLAGSIDARAQQSAPEFFQTMCASCHTIGGGRLVGPDLRDVTARKDRAWLVNFIQAPQAAMDRGDPYALQLRQDAKGVVMPTLPGVDRARAEALLDLIAAESALARSRFAGAQVAQTPFTAADIQRGRELFRGDVRLAGGGPPCISCHSVRDIGGLGGGRLAPDLTQVFARLQGRRGLVTWLGAPATPTMQTLLAKQRLTDAEIQPLVAYFEDAAGTGVQSARPATLNFLLLGFGATGVGLVVMNVAWHGRFRSVRRALVERSRIARG
jgi:mono/diheme cytochrome c family protein